VDTSLALRNKECFGLLGPNGAGKTTTISILTGMIMPTKGSASVGGFDIQTEIDYVFTSIGLCPQFDVHWEGLTVEETMLFYIRLRGVKISQEKEELEKKSCIRIFARQKRNFGKSTFRRNEKTSLNCSFIHRKSRCGVPRRTNDRIGSR